MLQINKAKRARLLLKSYIKEGMTVGDNVHFYSTITIGEPYLVKIGDNSTIANNVALITHDASIGALFDRSIYSDLCGRITIGRNSFIGYNSIILYGVSLADYTVVAAGSVVTKSFNQSNIIIGGNPARIIGSAEQYKEKYKDNFLKLHGLNPSTKKKIILDSKKLVEK